MWAASPGFREHFLRRDFVQHKLASSPQPALVPLLNQGDKQNNSCIVTMMTQKAASVSSSSTSLRVLNPWARAHCLSTSHAPHTLTHCGFVGEFRKLFSTGRLFLLVTSSKLKTWKKFSNLKSENCRGWRVGWAVKNTGCSWRQNLGSIPSTLTAAHNCLQWCDTSSGLQEHQADTQSKDIQIDKNKTKLREIFHELSIWYTTYIFSIIRHRTQFLVWSKDLKFFDNKNYKWSKHKKICHISSLENANKTLLEPSIQFQHNTKSKDQQSGT